MLLDRIITYGFPKLQKDLEMAELIIADNISEYYYEGSLQEHWDIFRDFPNIAPPFPIMFIEWQYPTRIISEIGITYPEKICRRLGTLVISRDITNMIPDLSKEKVAYMMWNIGYTKAIELGKYDIAKGIRRMKPEELYDSLPIELQQEWQSKAREAQEIGSRESLVNKIRWSSSYLFFAEMITGEIVQPSIYTLFVDKDGKPFGVPVGKDVKPAIMEGLSDFNAQVRLGNTSTSDLIHISLLTLSFMHCKNIVVNIQRYPQQQNKARLRKGKFPLITYRILEIEPIKKILENEGGKRDIGLKKSLHICRGHFKDYMTGDGLFGKIHGIWWWDMQTRGNIKEGISFKDYKVYAKEKGLKC